MTSEAEIILISMHDDGTSKNGVFSEESNVAIFEAEEAITALFCDNVSEVTYVAVLQRHSMRGDRDEKDTRGKKGETDLRIGTSVSLLEGVKVGTSADTSIGIVSQLMNVESVFPWLETRNLSLDDGGGFVMLL